MMNNTQQQRYLKLMQSKSKEKQCLLKTGFVQIKLFI